MNKFNWSVSAALLVTLAGCGSGDSVPEPENTQAADRSLQRVASAEAFSQSVREALVNQYTGGVAVPEAADFLAPTVVALVDTTAGTTGGTTGTTTGGSTAGTAGDQAASTETTGTNVQETGVDEADRVKSDGEFLYVLNSIENFYYPPDFDLIDIGAPPTATSPADSTSLPPGPTAYNTQIRILSLDHEAADATLVNELNMDIQNEHAGGLYHYKGDGFNSLVMTGTSLYGWWSHWDSSDYFGGQRSTIRKIDVANPEAAAVTDTLTVDGHIVSSRRVGKYLYVSSRFYPRVQGIDYSADTATVTDELNRIPLEDLMPALTEDAGVSETPLVDASNCFVAAKQTDAYYSPDIITLFVVDLDTMAVTDSVCYLGSSETLYASTDSIYLATTSYDYSGILFVDTVEPTVVVDPDEPVEETGTTTGGSTTTVVPPEEILTETNIHQFDFNGGQLTYRGSGAVKGHLGWNQSQKPFRMSEKDGFLRVATFSDSQTNSISPVLMSVLQPAENERLDLIAMLPNSEKPAHIGKPGEQLHASRFLGDKAYLVTFRQTDPLYVVDLSEPANPFIAGELEIEGYSDYLHPIDDDYLLGIGRGAIPTTDGGDDGRGAFATGVKLSLFDVSDPQSPTEVQAIEIGKRGTSADALNDHHGITVQRATADHPTRVTFGINVSDIDQGDGLAPWAWYGWRETGLHAFEVTTDANAGITEHGKIIVETPTSTNPYGPVRYGDRSVIVNDSVYYIHGEQVFGANWNSLGNFVGPR